MTDQLRELKLENALISWMKFETKQQLQKHTGIEYGDEFCLTVMVIIVMQNFPNCLKRYLEEGKFNG